MDRYDGTSDPAIEVAMLCTTGEQAKILAKLALLNGGRTEGIEVADALDIMYDSDAMLGKVESAFATFGRDHVGEWTPAHAMTVYVLAMNDIEARYETIVEFLARRSDRPEVEPDVIDAVIVDTIEFRVVGELVVPSEYFGDNDMRRGHEVAECYECRALVKDDGEGENRERHARSTHGLGATR